MMKGPQFDMLFMLLSIAGVVFFWGVWRVLGRGSRSWHKRKQQTEEILGQSEERFRRLVEAVKDYAIFMLDTEGYITTWNSGAERINGYTDEEIIGKHV